MPLERLDKILVSQNIGSRKEVQIIIRKGCVKVNNEVVKKSDTKIDAEKEEIKVYDETLNFRRNVYIMMNKPAGVISASRDPKMQTVIDLVPEALGIRGLFPAGRLDRDTEGLVIITNDGDFAHRMLLPKKEIYKRYLAVIDSEVTENTIEAFKNGITLKDGTECLPAKLEVLETNLNSLVQIEICEGKFHQVKKMFESVGMHVLYLKRVRIGKLDLDLSLQYGECKELLKEDVDKIFE